MPSFRKAFFNLFNSQKRVRQFTPDEQEKIYQKYRDSVGLTQDLTFGSEAFAQHAEKRIKDHTGFKTQIGSNKEDTLEKLLKDDSPNTKKEIKDELKSILTPQPFYTKAQEVYKESMEFFQQRMKQVPELSVEQLRGYHEQITTRARDALKAQQKKELKDLQDKAENLAQQIGTVANTNDPEQIKKIKENLIKDLESSHKTQLDEFNKTAQENLTTLDKASALERKRIIFSGQLESWAYQLSTSQKNKMLDEMERVRAENRKKRGISDTDALTGADINVGENTISAVNPADLDFIISLTGTQIVQKKAAKEGDPGTWQVHMSARILSPFYYLSNKQNPKVEMLTMAQAVRASGFDSITMTINFDDPKTQKQRARQAYEAALESGFNPGLLPGEESKGDKGLKGIVLKDGSGKEIDPRTLFTPTELELLHQEAAQRRERLKSIAEEPPKQPSTEVAKQYRGEIDKGRNEARAKAGKAAIDSVEEEQLEQNVKTTLSS
ncbi:hypothetical protein [Legionella sp. 227]|uniref:hypothetical protein n=1 Tax=Legionella sp. 227 TaxID=3367288 RepID=UPI00370D84D5